MRPTPAALLLLELLSGAPKAALALESNPSGSPQLLKSCARSQGRTSNCEVELDVPSSCVDAGGRSSCPIVFFLHGAGGSNDGFAGSSGVHSAGAIGVYPQGEDGWNTGPKNSNKCAWDDYGCPYDPDEGAFVAAIVDDLRGLGADGNIYMNGNSNGAALAMRIASNAGEELPVKGIVAKVTQLLASPPRSGPGVLNYNQPGTGGPPVSVLSIMGTADGLVPYEGGGSSVFGGDEAFQFMSALKSMSTWAAHNGCGVEAVAEDVEYSTDADPNGVATLYEYQGCPEGVIVEHYALHDAGHALGRGAAIDGVDIDYDLAFAFINRLEGNGGDDDDDDSCEDDPDWSGKFNEAHTCAYVGQNPAQRCGWESKDGTPASEACEEACGGCDPATTSVPTQMATTDTPTPTAAPAPGGWAPPCEDDPSWRGKFNEAHTCAFVGQNPGKRCGWESSDGTLASDACVMSCGQC